MAATFERVDLDRLQSIVEDLGPKVGAALDTLTETLAELYYVVTLLGARPPFAHQHGRWSCVLCGSTDATLDGTTLVLMRHEDDCPFKLAAAFLRGNGIG